MCKVAKPVQRAEAKQNARHLVWFYASIVILSQVVFFITLATMSDWPERVSSVLQSSVRSAEPAEELQAEAKSPHRLRKRIHQVARTAEEKLLDLQCGLLSTGELPVSTQFRGNHLHLKDVARGNAGEGRYQLYHLCVVNRPKESYETAQVRLHLVPTQGNVDLLVSFDNPRPSLESFDLASKHPGMATDELLLDSDVPDWPLSDTVHMYIGVVGGKGGGSYSLSVSTVVKHLQ